MATWKITNKKDLNVNNPVFIEGLPGLGNVGKIVADILVDELEAEKVAEFFSPTMPSSVFVNDEHLVEMPKIELYHKNINGKDFLFLTGDVQPSDEPSSYEFCNTVLDMMDTHKCEEIITIGGIGIEEDPEKPKVYATGNDAKLLQEYKKLRVDTKLYGVVGPIIGVSGLLVGMAGARKMKASCLLAETYGHPMYIGLKGAKQILKVLKKKYPFEFSFRYLNKEIKKMDFSQEAKHNTLNQLKQIKDTNYIG